MQFVIKNEKNSEKKNCEINCSEHTEHLIQLNNVTKIYSSAQLHNITDYINFLFFRKRNYYRRRVAVKEVSMQLRRGDKMGLVGLNGAGKSTLIKIITGILCPTSGRSLLFGTDSYKNRIKNNYNIGVVFGQRCQLRWDISPLDSYELLTAIYRLSKRAGKSRIDFIVEKFQLSEFVSQPVRNLSLGQKMLCELGAAFLHDPEILILDEPTLGLDLLVKERIQNILKNTNKTILVTSHDVSDIETICNRLTLLDQGEIILEQQNWGEELDLKQIIKTKYKELRCSKDKEDKDGENGEVGEVGEDGENGKDDI